MKYDFGECNGFFNAFKLSFCAFVSKLYFYSNLAGNIDQAQYCDRIKGIIELLGSKLSLDELTKIWRIQVQYGITATRLLKAASVL